MRSRGPYTRREFLLGLAGASALAGCARMQPLFTSYRSTTAVSPDGRLTTYPFTRADIETLPVPSLGVALGDSLLGIMFLTRYEADQGLCWESPHHYSLTTRAGRLVATKGLRRDLAATRFVTEDPLMRPPLEASALVRALTLVPGDHEDVRFESRLEPVGEESLTILERSYRAVRVREPVAVRRWQWQAENTYWIDVDSGAVIRSIQHIAPDSRRIVIDVFGAPA